MRLTPRHLFFLCFALTCAVFALSPSPSCAASGATSSAGAAATSCDPKFMEALRARAHLEAQREVVTNAATIWKPDSVMQLTCFDQQIAAVMRSGGQGFSEKKKVDDPPTPQTSTEFDRGVLAGATDIAEKQLGGNFTIELGGGNSAAQGLAYSMPPEGTDAASYESLAANPCNSMRQVWTAARCANIDPDKAFVSLPLFATGKDEKQTLLNDPRNAGVLKAGSGLSGSTIDCDSTGFNNGLAASDQLLNQPGVGSAGFTPASLFASVTAPYSQLKSSSGAQGNCFPGIKTGVMLGSGVEEVVCPNPGCIPKSGTCQPQS
jgi:hypothetical protein